MFLACNDMGLICINELQNEKLAEKYLQESGTNNYPIGQNCYSVFLFYYLKNKEKAKQILEKCSSENHLALSEFILGHLFDEENKTNESINYYIKVIEDINLPIMFLNEKINDKMFQLSQKFIACFTSIILIQYYLFKKDYQNARKYFIYYISNRNLLNIYKDFENVFSNINQFLTRLIEDEFEFKKINNFSKVNSKFMYMKEKLDYLHNNKVYKKQNESPQNNIDLLFDSIIFNPCNLNYFIREVNIAIKKVNSILFTPPYSIIFGRINLYKNAISTTCRNSNTTQNINKFFLDGLKP